MHASTMIGGHRSRTARARLVPVAILAVLACGLGTEVAHAGLSERELKNATYAIPNSEGKTFRLKDGRAVFSYGPHKALHETVTLIGPVAFGEFSGDKKGDAAVILSFDAGGGQPLHYLAAMVDAGGAPKNIATSYLGEQISVHGLAIRDRAITVTVVEPGASEPRARTYTLQGQWLVRR